MKYLHRSLAVAARLGVTATFRFPRLALHSNQSITSMSRTPTLPQWPRLSRRHDWSGHGVEGEALRSPTSAAMRKPLRAVWLGGRLWAGIRLAGSGRQFATAMPISLQRRGPNKIDVFLNGSTAKTSAASEACWDPLSGDLLLELPHHPGWAGAGAERQTRARARWKEGHRRMAWQLRM